VSLAQPLISVLMTTYNHEKYIGDAVRSVLAQTFEDFEAVIIDDGSTDRTGDVVCSFADPRLRYLRQENQGPSVATTTALAACRGKYLALMSGDDVLHPDRLRRQVEAYGPGPTRVLFAGVDFIDEDGRPLDGDFYPGMVKDANPTRARLFEQLFFSWPGFFGVTAFTERHVIVDCGPDDPALFQTQDYARWVHLLKHYEFQILPDRLYKFRIRTGWENLSGPQVEKQVRAQNERYLVMRSFFRDVPRELFREAFRPHLLNPAFSSDVEQACEEAFLYLHSAAPLNQLIGIERLHQLLHEPEAREVLHRAYRFDFARFAETLKTLNVTNMFAGQNSAALVDQGDGWRPENIVRQPINPDVPRFRLVFDLDRFASPRVIAWVPFEGPRLGRVKVERCRYRDAGGAWHDLGPGDLTRHGCSRTGDEYVFDTVQPRLSFAPPGPVMQLEVAGRLDLVPAAETFGRLTAALAEKQATIDRLTRQVKALQSGGDGRSLWARLRRRAGRTVRRLFSD
jgi:glycosyltransferase involved in cell wall biosynthesis